MIHQDESISKQTNTLIWSGLDHLETKVYNALIGKYKHEISIHVIGTISRLSTSRLSIFEGTLNAEGLSILAEKFLIPFIREKLKYDRLLSSFSNW